MDKSTSLHGVWKLYCQGYIVYESFILKRLSVLLLVRLFCVENSSWIFIFYVELAGIRDV